MIKALEYGPDGDATIVCGLSWRNLELISYGRPIRFPAGELGVDPGFEVWLVGGPDLPAIIAGLRSIGIPGPGPARDGDGLLAFFTHVDAGPGRRAVPVAIAAISAAADRRLRTGAELSRPLGGGRPGLRLIAGPDTDRLAATITAGKPVLHAVDRRGGRGNT